MIEVYMDESGVHGESPAVTSSAVWARPSVWKAWTRDWCLKKGPISVFHAQECHSRTGEGWSREDRDALVVGQLLPLVRKHKIFGRFSGLDLNTYRAQLAAHPDVLDWFGHPYIACFQWTLRSLCQAAVHHHQTAVAIIHEINDYKEGILWTVQYTQRKFPGLSLSVEFGSKADFVPLQCADIVAYEGFKYLGNVDKPRLPLVALDPSGTRMKMLIWSKYNCGLMVSQLRDHYADLKQRARI